MLNKIKNVMKNQRGLTLVELLAVIVILGIVSSIAVVSIGNVIQRTREDAVRADAMQILNAAELYIAQGGIITTTDTISITPAVPADPEIVDDEGTPASNPLAHLLSTTTTLVDANDTPIEITIARNENGELTISGGTVAVGSRFIRFNNHTVAQLADGEPVATETATAD